ncbi:hypothetical protein JKF63_04378 [Porcisia hertigi]|uniref:TFIIS N-terminal domain-containing protein n=1 Tax=Porcisia hertigi TaxID=2761500 RepID=A0A836IGF9_9TRYP|nr:hypothetical protein JKF63_04378 [Porcisia hertigi]
MEEEDTILGLAPASLPVHADGEDLVSTIGFMADLSGSQAAAVANAGDGDGWGFEESLRAAHARTQGGNGGGAKAGQSSGEVHDEDDDSDEEQAEDVVDFRDDGASSGAVGGDQMDDVALQMISDKKAAKRLGKKLYKRWKKLHKTSKSRENKHKSSKKDKKASKKTSKSTEKASRDKRTGGRKGHKKKDSRTREDDSGDEAMFLNTADGANGMDDELGLVPAVDLSSTAAAVEARLQKAALREAKMRTEKAATKAAQRKTSSAELVVISKELVAAMAKARKLDEDIISGRNTLPGAFPLNRVALKSIVQARCRQAFMVGPLVEGGILQELSYWLYDVDRAEPAPYELRTAALEILLSLPMEGSIAATEDLTAFMGVSREHLIKTDLGRALNALRRYSDETIDNKSKCVQLLTSFSRVISGTSVNDQTDDHKSRAVWRCQSDPTVASPFEVLETCSEAFQKSFMKPDPRDPTSYNGVLPWRPPAATITNVSGRLGDYIEKANINARR